MFIWSVTTFPICPLLMEWLVLGPQDHFFKGNANLPELFPSVLLLVGFHLPSLSVY